MITSAADRRNHLIEVFEEIHNCIGVLPIDPTPAQLDRVMFGNGDTAVICEEGFNIHFVYETGNVILAHYIFNTDSGICICNFDRTITEDAYHGARNILSDILPGLMQTDEDNETTDVFCCINKPVRIDLDAEPVERLSAEEIAKRIIASLSYEDLDDDED